jgi:hypothetical protein
MAAVVVPAVVSGALAAAGPGFTIAGIAFSGWSAFAVVAGANLVMGLAMGALGGKPKMPDRPSFQAQTRDRTQVARTTSDARSVIFGEARVAGPLVCFESSGSDNKYLHVAVPHAAHPCAEIVGWFANDEPVGSLDGSGIPADGRFKGKIRLTGHLGSFDQAADSAMVSEVSGWTSADKGGGVTYTAARLEWDSDTWPNGFSNLEAQVRGLFVFDPRDTPIVIVGATAADPAVFSTDGAHGLSVGDYVWIGDCDGTRVPTGSDERTAVEKMHQVATVPDSTHFTLTDQDGIALALSAAATTGTASRMEWSDNWALCVASYMALRDVWDTPDAEIDMDQLAAAANICDEQVSLADDGKTFTATASSDSLTLGEACRWRTGDGVMLSSTGALPVGLSAGTTYYVRRLDTTTIKLATTLENARRGVFVDISDSGSGTHTVTRKSQPRYTCNGVATLDTGPLDTLEAMMTAASGVVVYSEEGKFQIFPGAATASTGTIDESALGTGDIEVIPMLDGGDIFNSARGTFIDPDRYWTMQDIVPWSSAAYVAEDNGQRIYRDFEMQFTHDPVAAQRLLKIAVERARQGMVANLTLKPLKFGTAVWDVESVSLDHFGWAAKEFRVMSLKERADLSLQIGLKEEAAAVWEWNAGDETIEDLAPNTNLPSVLTVQPPTGLSLESGTAALVIKGDGTVVSRIKASFASPADIFVTQGGHVQARWKPSASSVWVYGAMAPGAVTELFAEPVEDGTSYDMEVRAINSAGVKSDRDSDDPWQASVAGHIVSGKAEAPSNVSALSAQQNGNVVTFRWPAITDLDRNGYELRYMAAPFVWDDALVLTRETKGTLISNAGLPPGSWVVGVKAVDTSGNYSASAATTTITVSNGNAVIAERMAHPRWVGTLSGFIRHDVSGTLIPDSGTLAADMSDSQLWDRMVHDPVADPYFEAPGIDIGQDASVRLWGIPTANLGPGEGGVSDPILAVAAKPDGGSYGDFQDWSAGTVYGRYFKVRVRLDTATGVAAITGFSATVDAEARQQRFDAQAISAGGTALVFSPPFLTVPGIEITARQESGAARIGVYSGLSASGVTIHLHDTADADVGGTATIVATGP